MPSQERPRIDAAAGEVSEEMLHQATDVTLNRVRPGEPLTVVRPDGECVFVSSEDVQALLAERDALEEQLADAEAECDELAEQVRRQEYADGVRNFRERYGIGTSKQADRGPKAPVRGGNGRPAWHRG